MPKNSFKEIRSSMGSSLFGTSIESNSIRIWDVMTHESLIQIDCLFSGGQSRILINEREQIVIISTWEHGLRGYDLSTGNIIWERTDILGIQSLQASFAIPRSVFVSVETPSYNQDAPNAYDGVLELSTLDGKEKWKTDQLSEVYAAPNDALLLGVNRSEREIHFINKQKKILSTTPMKNFAVLDVAFGKDSLLIAEGQKGIRVFDKNEFTLKSSWEPKGRNGNSIRAGYVTELSKYVVQDSWDDSFLIHFSEQGQLIKEQKLPSHATLSFIDNGRYFLQPNGEIYTTELCQPLGRIEIK